MAHREEPSETDLIKGVIRGRVTQLGECANVMEILPSLYSGSVIDIKQKQRIAKCDEHKGNIAAGETFWNMVMDDEIPVPRLMKVLNKENPSLHESLVGGVQDIRTGKVSLYGLPNTEGIRQMLESKYLSKEDFSDLEFFLDEDSVTTPLSEQMLTPVFTAEQVRPDSTQSQSMVHRKRKVSEKDYSTFEAKCLWNVVSKLSEERDPNLTDLQPNLVEMLGDAGTGKTTTVKQLAWLWASGKCDFMKGYEFVFYIPLREVSKYRLTDILCDMGLIPMTEQTTLCEYFGKKDHASKVLFILDGCDENDIPVNKDLYNLLTGRLFPSCHIVMTARPEASCLTSFDRKPSIKVRLHGTDKESVDKVLAEVVKEDLSKFQERYEETISDISLLFIPLYLILFRAVLKESKTEGPSSTNIMIPESMTMLFNSFMNVIIGRWLQKKGYKKVKVTFSKSPLDSDSTVPDDIQRAIYFIGRLCYKGLMENKCTFTDTDAKAHLLTMETISLSGLFTTGRSEHGKIFFTKHKQLQEYLSSLYLAYEGPNEKEFHQMMHSDDNKAKSFADVAHGKNIIKLVQFTCGVSAQFLRNLFANMKSGFCLRRKDNSVDIYYECVLFMEQHISKLSTVKNSCELDGYEQFVEYLSEVKQTQSFEKDYLTDFTQKCLRKVASLFSKEQAVDLLCHFYDKQCVPVSNKNTDFKLGPPHPETRITLCLDQLQAELMNFIRVPGLQKVYVKSPVTFVDLTGLLQTFPQLHRLKVESDFYIPYMGSVRYENFPSTKSTSATLRKLDLRSPKQLTYFSLASHDKPECLVRALTKCLPHLTNLHTLKMWDVKVEEQAKKQFSESLKSLKQLESLTFQPHHVPEYSAHILIQCLPHFTNLRELHVQRLRLRDKRTEQELTECLKSLKQLEHLILVLIFDIPNEISSQILTNCLSCLPKLKTVEVAYPSHDDLKGMLCNYHSNNLKTVVLLDVLGSSDDNRLPDELTRQFKEKGIEISCKQHDV